METNAKLYLDAMLFKNPQRVPLQPGRPRKPTLEAWRAQELPDGAHYLDYTLGALGLPASAALTTCGLKINFKLLPEFETRLLRRENGHLIAQDAKGAVVMFSDKFPLEAINVGGDFITWSWLEQPVKTRRDFERIKKRYNPDDPGRFPDNARGAFAAAKQRVELVAFVVNGPFWQMRDWVGFEELCIMMVEDPGFVHEMAGFWTQFMNRMLKRMLEVVQPHQIIISEDMAYKAHAMISPAMARKFLVPSYKK